MYSWEEETKTKKKKKQTHIIAMSGYGRPLADSVKRIP
jgi:hypothetical protein